MRSRRVIMVLLLLGLTVASPGLRAFDEAGWREDSRKIAAHPHRLSGTAEYGAAADYVLERMRQIGLDAVFEQPFPTAQTETLRCEVELLDAGGRSIGTLPLVPMRPNGLIPPVSPVAGLAGPLVRGGDGRGGSFAESPRGAIAVLDYDSGTEWLRAFRLGAKAVIFLDRGAFANAGSRYTRNNANLPRFFYEGDPEALLAADRVRIHSEVVWKRAAGRNLVGYLEGTDPVMNLERPEVVIYGTHLDSFGEVPERSRGFRGAANVAALLQLAERLRAERPRRNVVFLFVDNLARGHSGGLAFARALDGSSGKAAVARREESLAYELSFIAQLRELLAAERPLEGSSQARDELAVMVRKESDTASTGIRLQLADLRAELEITEDPERREAVARHIEALDAERIAWSDFKRALERNRLDEEVAGKLQWALDRVEERTVQRAAELVVEKAALEADRRIHEQFGSQAIVLHTALILGGKSDRWGLVIGGNGEPVRGSDTPGLYSPIQSVFLKTEEARRKAGAATAFVTETAEGLFFPPSMFFAGSEFVHSGEPLGRLAIYNVALATAQDDLAFEGTPRDTRENLDEVNLAVQVADVIDFAADLTDRIGLSRRAAIKKAAAYIEPVMTDEFRIFGARAVARMPGSSIADTPMGNVVMMIRPNFNEWDEHRADRGFDARKLPAYDDFYLVRTNAHGAYSLGPFDTNFGRNRAIAVSFDSRGMVAFASPRAGNNNFDARMQLYPARHGAIALAPEARPGQTWLFDGESNSRVDDKRVWDITWDGVYSWFHDIRVDRVKFFGSSGLVALGVPTAEEIDRQLREVGVSADRLYFGAGYPADSFFAPLPVAETAARDLIRIDSHRLDVMRERGVTNNSVDEIHGAASDLLAEALAASDPEKAEARATAAFLQERRVYGTTLQATQDLVTAVIILLILTIPFAFSLERLLIGAPNIYQQILGFVGFFIVAFLALYFTHPAFAIAATPLVIFLGFAIVLLSSFVIAIVMQKFEAELKELQGLAGTVHSADVSRISTIVAAMQMGISSMRRRPVRTALTGITIILLTYTILTFASFGNSLGTIRIYEAASPAYSAAMTHRTDWRQMDNGVLDVLSGRFGDDAEIAPRAWYNPEIRAGNQAPQNAGMVLSRDDLTAHVTMAGIIGITPQEVAARPDWRRLLGDPAEFEDRIWISRSIAERLDIGPGSPVRLGGHTKTVGAVFDPADLLSTNDMDGDTVLPVDLSLIAPQGDSGGEDDGGDGQSWTYLSPDAVVILAYEEAVSLGANLRVVHAYTGNVDEAARIAEQMTAMTGLPVHATRKDGVYRHLFGATVEASGVNDLLFPILLGGLVIFGTMLGSVADREKEIYTFSALGLAPTHVASLFFAEALVFSVVGGMGGYLFSQIVMALLDVLAGYGLVTVPEMNYSSINSVVTILIVMATVMISAIYPAIKASNSANPGVMRSWQMPEPMGDIYSIVFPFTVSQYDITGVVSFLKEHFDGFADTSVGVFMAEDARLTDEGDGEVGLKARLALAPFDLGVTQEFHLTSIASEIPGIDEVQLRLERLSGQPKDWVRLNKILMDDLRKQFLIWRSLPQNTMETYRARTLVALGREEEAAESRSGKPMRPESAG